MNLRNLELEVDSYDSLSEILVKSVERYATRVDLKDLLDRGTRILVISCEGK